MTPRIPYYRQQKDYTCGPAVLRMILASLGKRVTEKHLARLAGTSAQKGTSNFSMARMIGSTGLPYITGQNVGYGDLRAYVKHGITVIEWMPQHLFPGHCAFEETHNYNPEKDSHYALVVAASAQYVTLQDPVLGRRVRVGRKGFIRAWRDWDETHLRWFLTVLGQ